MDKKKLPKCLQALDALLAFSVRGCKEQDLLEKLQNVKELLKNFSLEVHAINNRLEKCSCLGKQLFCLLSVIALECGIFLDALSSNNDNTLDAVLSLKQKQSLLQILEFTIHNGVVSNLDFQISMLIPKSQNSCQMSMLDLFVCCRYLVFAGNSDDAIRNFLVSKHLLPLLAGFIQLTYSPYSSQILSPDELGFCRKTLSNLIVKWAPLKDVVKCLFVIQGSSSRVNPLWINKACGSILSKCLLRDNGVVAVISSLLLTLGSDASALKKVEVASKLLSTPSRASNEKQYYYIICKQILTIFQSAERFEEDSDKVSTQILVATIMSLYKKSPNLTTQFFFEKLLSPFQNFYAECRRTDSNDVSVLDKDSSIDIGDCIEMSHTLLVAFKHHLQKIVIKDVFLPHFRGLFALYSWSRSTVSHYQNLLKQLLSKCLNVLDCDSAASLLLWFCGIFVENQKLLLDSLFSVKASIGFAINDDGNIVLQLRDVASKTPEEVIDDQNKKVEAMLELLTCCKVPKLSSRVFILICKHIETVSEQMKSEEKSNELLTNDERASLHLQFGESQLIAYALLTSLCETADSKELFEDIDEITSFIKILLSKACNLTDDLEQAAIRRESLKLSFAVLGLCLLDVPAQHSSIKCLVPLLQKLSVLNHVSVEDREIASDLAVAIATHGAVGGLNFEAFSKTMQNQVKDLESKFSQQSKLSKMDETSDIQTKVHNTATNKDTVSCKNSKTISKATKLESKLLTQQKTEESTHVYSADSLKDAIASMYESCPSSRDDMMKSFDNRAAGLRYIASAMKKKVSEVINQAEKIRDILLEVLLREEDSFVYLSAIQALVETVNKAPMTSINTRIFFDHLVHEYQKHIQTPGEEAELKAIKVGEVVVRVVDQLGDLADYQSSKLLPILFIGSRDERAPIRCSCLSNLAQLCPLMRQKVSVFQFELSECICATVIHDDEVIVRRSAVHLLRKLIETLESEMLKIFPNSMKQFYSVIKRSYQHDDDQVVQLHAQLALEALDQIMRDVMFHSAQEKHKTMEKKITILS